MGNAFGDIDVKILDEEAGGMEPVIAVCHFKIGEADENWVELLTSNQFGESVNSVLVDGVIKDD